MEDSGGLARLVVVSNELLRAECEKWVTGTKQRAKQGLFGGRPSVRSIGGRFCVPARIESPPVWAPDCRPGRGAPRWKISSRAPVWWSSSNEHQRMGCEKWVTGTKQDS